MSRRVLTLLVAVALAGGCVVAGVWQWSRHSERSATAALVTANYDAEPAPVGQVLSPGLADDDVWRPVVVVGRYVGEPVLLRGRPVSGSPAVHELGVVEIAAGPHDGARLVVNRGWLPLAPDEGLPALPGRPTGVVELVVRLRPLEDPAGRALEPGQVRRVAAAEVTDAAGLPADVLPAYGTVLSEGGGAPDGLQALPRPELRVGVNLSYAFQWWLFAVGALVGGFLLARQDPSALTPRPADGAPRRRSAEDEEDAILDAQEAITSTAPPGASST